MNEVLKKVALSKLKFDEATPIKGGDINDAFRLECDGKPFFLKLNVADSLPELFRKEADNLNFLSHIDQLILPNVIDYGVSQDNFQFLILEWLEKKTPTEKSWIHLANNMAKLHRTHQENFGWTEDTYCAIVLQPNISSTQWEEFFSENRILPMAKLLRDKNLIGRRESQQLDKYCKQINSFFPIEQPSLLHGDFWSGNILPIDYDQIALIDPSSYFGHREIDMAMSKLFGGFDQQFYHSYQEIYPLEETWQERLPYTQLYPLMLHALLFEGYYLDEVQSILKKL
ncbi:fructosamine kinase family protein [Weeksella virosa]|uniref:Fructosamine/Ketosamine-3-kinase n=1 Tax=Weeksella virosa (strain ATCC 43766 / DSM 16922 / JCM 21250 / CCUG 30538 / CDC 9751 / IAM 14551 / NBRC 16016 / NCTC 11634 / CL345/78) TaxID=865938 RepID=F0P2E2_WEEVC|nr:fructosamine kinase family protein [Weeksella virosa]ADX66754.1 Fructosamine/Ketosamine-3-kinase [Weeksella virosa DSM 16922]MDK7675155.1 fructosamine kinase family protein [Weeksella virosa]SUP53014.1 Fructosamine-3-kinase [Weeksella virosa]VEH63523.1 Fructosamine-3-kinase [Weeksella virosa]